MNDLAGGAFNAVRAALSAVPGRRAVLGLTMASGHTFTGEAELPDLSGNYYLRLAITQGPETGHVLFVNLAYVETVMLLGVAAGAAK